MARRAAPASRARQARGPPRRSAPVSSFDAERAPFTATDAIAGILAAASLTLSVVALAERPARLVPAAIVLALVAGRMSRRFERLSVAAMFVAAAAWVVGLTIAVVTDGQLL